MTSHHLGQWAGSMGLALCDIVLLFEGCVALSSMDVPRLHTFSSLLQASKCNIMTQQDQSLIRIFH